MISRLGIIANLGKPQVKDAVERCLRAAEDNGLTAVVAQTEAENLGLDSDSCLESELPDRVDAVVSFGGDGTFLRAARIVGDSGTPLLGINLGSLGFMADVRVEKIADAMELLARAEYRLERRRRVGVDVIRGGEVVFQTSALNDIVLNMGPVPRAIDLDVRIEDTRVGQYLSDGLIVATPTGSTAYNLSAGGPIVDSSVEAFLLTPICPHTLAVRPMILSDNKPIQVRLAQCPGGVLTGDGQVSIPVKTNDVLVFHRVPHVAYFIRLSGLNLFQVIQEKLKWGGHPRRLDPSDEGYDVG